ncbi:MAG TPA: hypothetical protein VHT91_24875 [Kofleriaceae bacterium]|nr:hypothetical protein [Kofleriaceae bacterium]
MTARLARTRQALALAAALAACGCGKKPTHRQAGDAAAVEVVTAPVVPDGGAPGTISDEVEPNDSNEVATVLPLGATVHGKIDPDTDVDRYRIDVTQAGALSVMVDGHDALDPVLEIEDGSGTVIARSDRTGARIREGVPNLGVTPGRYTAVVTAKKPPPPAAKKRTGKRPAPEPVRPAGGPYEITAVMAAPAAGFEHEPDDDRGEANDLIAGDTGSGYLGWSGDADVWKISVETLSAKNANALDVELTAVEGVALSLEIADGIGQPIVTRKGARGAALAVRGFTPSGPPGAPPFYYLTVRGDRSNPETAYQLRVTAKVQAPDREVEPNDTPETATSMADRKSLGAHWSTGDVDCFAVPPADTSRTFDVSIDTPRDLDLAIDLLIDGKLMEKVDHPGKGAAEKLVMTVPPGAHAVIRVRGADLPGEDDYEIVINESAAAP